MASAAIKPEPPSRRQKARSLDSRPKFSDVDTMLGSFQDVSKSADAAADDKAGKMIPADRAPPQDFAMLLSELTDTVAELHDQYGDNALLNMYDSLLLTATRRFAMAPQWSVRIVAELLWRCAMCSS